MEVLDTSFLKKYNFVMVERHVPQSMVLEVLMEEEIDTESLNDKEIEKLLPPLFCPCVDLYEIVEDEGVVYIPTYKAPTNIISFEEGDAENDFCE